MRNIVDKLLWGTLLILFGPSVMIIASWNALPGDNLYGVKLALERTALALASPSYATTGNLQIKYTERRFAEAKQLMASKQSIQGLPYLQQQIAETKKAIENAPSQETQVALAKQYINTLTTVSAKLEEQKTALTTSPQPIAYAPSTVPPPTQQQATATPTPSPTSGLRSITPIPTPSPSPSPTQMAQVTTTMPIPAQQAVVALQINQTQQNVNQTIANLQELVDKVDRDQKDNRPKQEEEKGKKDERNERKSNNDDKTR
ncbi:hypothetical protein HY339_03320 [Candidatus Gottesmanbacteria bacterium]|nr:hypothetical protein [Candidatus Gottesmanbacteria bacterium]